MICATWPPAYPLSFHIACTPTQTAIEPPSSKKLLIISCHSIIPQPPGRIVGSLFSVGKSLEPGTRNPPTSIGESYASAQDASNTLGPDFPTSLECFWFCVDIVDSSVPKPETEPKESKIS